MSNLKVIIKGLEETPFVWDSKKHSLLSFIGFTLNAAHLASSKELAEPLTANVNGEEYQFLDKQINIAKESLPKKERVQYIAASLLKRNYVGFVLAQLFAGNTDFQKLPIVKDKNTNTAAQKAENLSQLVEILLTDYKERKLTETFNKLAASKICLETGVGMNIPLLQKANKTLSTTIKAFLTVTADSVATTKNEETRAKRAAK